jgi:hypothetical protein
MWQYILVANTTAYGKSWKTEPVSLGVIKAFFGEVE